MKKGEFEVGDLVVSRMPLWEERFFGARIPEGTTGIVSDVNCLGEPSVCFELWGSRVSEPTRCSLTDIEKL